MKVLGKSLLWDMKYHVDLQASMKMMMVTASSTLCCSAGLFCQLGITSCSEIFLQKLESQQIAGSWFNSGCFGHHAGPDAEAANRFLWNCSFRMLISNVQTCLERKISDKKNPLDFCQIRPDAPAFIRCLAMDYPRSGGQKLFSPRVGWIDLRVGALNHSTEKDTTCVLRRFRKTNSKLRIMLSIQKLMCDMYTSKESR